MNAVVVFTLTISLSFSISLHARARILFRETFDDEAQQHRGEKKNARFFVR
tara:strand:- start:1555 stop:1707 length:153 start_codon:yes stop_codon:yes gene_type:complete